MLVECRLRQAWLKDNCQQMCVCTTLQLNTSCLLRLLLLILLTAPGCNHG